MSENADLERKAIEALRHYREALATAEQLEQEEAAARQELFKRIDRFDAPNVADRTSPEKPEVVAASQAAISRLSEVRTALSRATAALDAAYRALAALDEELGYIPGVTVPKPGGPSAGNSPKENDELA